MNLTPQDQELIDVATSLIKRNFLLGKHHVGASVRMSNGKVYAAVHLESKTVDVCAEEVAIGMAASNGEKGIDTIVAVTMRDVEKPTVIPPCDTCKELINFYGQDAWVIVSANEKRKVKDV